MLGGWGHSRSEFLLLRLQFAEIARRRSTAHTEDIFLPRRLESLGRCVENLHCHQIRVRAVPFLPGTRLGPLRAGEGNFVPCQPGGRRGLLLTRVHTRQQTGCHRLLRRSHAKLPVRGVSRASGTVVYVGAKDLDEPGVGLVAGRSAPKLGPEVLPTACGSICHCAVPEALGWLRSLLWLLGASVRLVGDASLLTQQGRGLATLLRWTAQLRLVGCVHRRYEVVEIRALHLPLLLESTQFLAGRGSHEAVRDSEPAWVVGAAPPSVWSADVARRQVDSPVRLRGACLQVDAGAQFKTRDAEGSSFTPFPLGIASSCGFGEDLAQGAIIQETGSDVQIQRQVLSLFKGDCSLALYLVQPLRSVGLGRSFQSGYLSSAGEVVVAVAGNHDLGHFGSAARQTPPEVACSLARSTEVWAGAQHILPPLARQLRLRSA